MKNNWQKSAKACKRAFQKHQNQNFLIFKDLKQLLNTEKLLKAQILCVLEKPSECFSTQDLKLKRFGAFSSSYYFKLKALKFQPPLHLQNISATSTILFTTNSLVSSTSLLFPGRVLLKNVIVSVTWLWV